jgi:hypothetical protein
VAGQKLYVNVGGAATGDRGESGGFNGGGSSGHYGGGGGGASDVRTVSRSGDPLESLESRLIVAGGGGGSGTNQGCTLPDGSSEFLTGGAGGDAGSDGGDGEPCGSLAGGTGGKAGTQSEGGLGGSPEGQKGSLGQGGDAFLFGGAGGGGYYGGGGGGDQTSAGSSSAAAGGGGGGSNLVPAGGSATIADAGPSITISYTDPTADTTPPVVTVPGPITNEATSPDGAVVTFNATAEDVVDGSVEVTCTPPSGSTFPIGTTTVTCTATDGSGNSSSATFDVIVQDTTPPTLSVSHTADGTNGWNKTSPVTVNVSASDSGSGGLAGAPSCKDGTTDLTLASGTGGNWTASVSGEGTHIVECTVSDQAGNQSTASDTVKIDTQAPTVTSTFPRDGREVGPAANIMATFSEDMDSASVVNAFKLFKKGSTNQIAAAVTYDTATHTATLNPTTNLRRGATYKAVVSPVAKDVAGNRLDQDGSRAGLQQKVWFFEID